MRSCVYTLAICLVGLAISCGAENVPVFIWGDLEYTSHKANPLSTTSAAQLERELRSELTDRQTLIAFVEETLSVEDLSRRDSSGASSLPYLRSNRKDSLYFPAVNSPVEGIAKLASEDLTDTLRLTASGLTGETRPSSTVVIVELSDARADETRADMLRRHDRVIRETVEEYKEKGRVVAVYTARYPSWVAPEGDASRFRRQLMQAEEGAAAAVASGDIKVFNTTNLIIAVANITITKSGNTATLSLSAPTVVANATRVLATLQDAQYKVSLQFDDSATYGGYWYLTEAQLTEVSSNQEQKYTVKDVFAPHNFSYHCSPGLEFVGANGTFTLKLDNLQVQPFFGGNADKFGDSFDCIGFFSMPIWAGLFVVTLLLMIFFYGVVNMMDIRTMDRFDDPKGKTITISATE